MKHQCPNARRLGGASPCPKKKNGKPQRRTRGARETANVQQGCRGGKGGGAKRGPSNETRNGRGW